MEGILEEAASLGASYAAYTVLRLPLEVSPLFQEWLEAFAPTRANRIMRHIRDINGGKNYDPSWSRGGEIRTAYAQLISKRFHTALARYGLSGEAPPLDLSRFKVPPQSSSQMSLF